jgi:hypothetical protein
MDPIALRPRKATEIIDAAIEVYRRNPLHFLLVAAVIRVPWLIVQIIVIAPIQKDIGAIMVPSMLISFGSMLTTFVMAGWIVQLASDIYLGHQTDAFDSLRRMAPRIPAVFVAAMLQTVAIWLGLFLLLFPAVWISAMVFAVVPAVVLERLGPFKAFDRSGALSQGVKLHVLAALGLIVAIWLVVKIGTVVLVQVLPTPVLQMTVGTLTDILIYPLFGIASTLIYYDIRIRKEGLDLEIMAKQAGSASTHPSAVPT